jgi:hypothetical protein
MLHELYVELHNFLNITSQSNIYNIYIGVIGLSTKF